MTGFDACVGFTLRPENEGAYVDNPADPGGPTNLGITLEGLSEWRGEQCTAADIRALTVAEAQAIYWGNYWQPINGDKLAAGVDLMVFDFGVNNGPQSSARMMQRIVRAAADAGIGPDTIRRAACAGAALDKLIAELAAAQEAFYASLHSQIFGKGWLARTRRRQAASLLMAAAPTPPSGS